MGEDQKWPTLGQILGALTTVQNKKQWRKEKGDLSALTIAKGEIHCKQTNGRRCGCVNWQSEYAEHWNEHERNNNNNETCNTDVWHQVLWGSKWRGYLDHPWGTTLTFQRKAGMSYGTCMRHGVAMHPRGRHLREVMTLMPHGLTTLTACEQQMKPLLHNQQLLQQERKGAVTIATIGSYGARQESKQKAFKQVSPARRQSEELYSNVRRGTW